jgi:hypothetical protein
MKINYCPRCGVKIHGQTRFCSKCGISLAELKGHQKSAGDKGDFKEVMRQFIEKFIEGNSDVLKDLSAKVEKGEGFEKGMFFSVEMKGDKPVIKSGDVKDLEKIIKRLPGAHSKIFSGLEAEDVLDFVESEAVVEKTRAGQKISLKLPGVSNIDDVTLNETCDSVEILGKSDGTIYFSRVPLEDGFDIKETRLEGETLIVTVHVN